MFQPQAKDTGTILDNSGDSSTWSQDYARNSARRIAKEEDVFTLQEGEIYGKSSIENPEQINETYRYLLTLVCIQETPDSERIYLKGNCNISRSPVIYPGDGKPFQIT